MKICDLEKCTSCGVCSTLCPKNAIMINVLDAIYVKEYVRLMKKYN